VGASSSVDEGLGTTLEVLETARTSAECQWPKKWPASTSALRAMKAQ
jgi:hypothetical protein